jgi:hypothetical protein
LVPALTLSLAGQQTPSSQRAANASVQPSLNDDAIGKLAKAGLSDDLIISTIVAQSGAYDTSVDGLIALKRAGVSDRVVAVIVAKTVGTASVPAPTPATAAPSVSTPAGLPVAVDSVGIYYKDTRGAWQEVSAEVVNFKTGGALKQLASVGLIKGDLNGHIGGNSSRLVLRTPATFILYVPEGRSPGEYQLLRLHANSNNREFRSLTGGVVHVTGGAIRDSVEFTTRKIAPRAYEITMGSAIGNGEYGFLPPLDFVSEKSLASSGKIYTFSIVDYGLPNSLYK